MLAYQGQKTVATRLHCSTAPCSIASLPPPHPTILTVPNTTGLVTGEVGTIWVGAKGGLGIGDCRGRGVLLHTWAMWLASHPTPGMVGIKASSHGGARY